MASFKHAYVSPVADAGNPNEVGPAEWNSEHTVTLATGMVLGRQSPGTGAVEEIPIASIGAGGGITQADADLRYVNITGDTMTGTLQFPNDTVAISQRDAANTSYLQHPYIDSQDRLRNALPTLTAAAIPTTGTYANNLAVIDATGDVSGKSILALNANTASTGLIYAINAYGVTTDNTVIQLVNFASTNIGATAGSRLALVTQATGGGDPRISFSASGGSDWAFGLDNDQGDRLAWATNTWLGTSDKMILDTAGNLTVTGNVTSPNITALATAVLAFVIDGGGSAITTGIKGDLEIPFNCTITGWTLLADQTGSIVIDVWKDGYVNYPPTVADTITASAKPTVSSSTKGPSSTLTGWAPAIVAGQTLRFNVDSAATITRVTISLKVTRT